MTIVYSLAEMRALLHYRAAHRRVGFVPTMGALHEGHLALVRLARHECDHVVASIFVNPAQFNDAADLAAYPRTEMRDAQLARDEGVDVLFIPTADEMYEAGRATSIEVGGSALGFEGAHRPGHFAGVALVCLKLFHLVEPHVVYLGQKDAQQVAVLSRMIRDLNLRLDVRVGPTVREADGLARSSRNARLSAEDRERAAAIPRALCAGLAAHRRGADPVAAARAELAGLDVDYVDLADFEQGRTLVVAASAGRTRLIDNVPLDHPELAGLDP